MELREMTTDLDRALFCRTMHAAHTERSGLIMDTQFSKISRIQLQFARLFALFDDTSHNSHEAIGGFSLHALNEYAQTFPAPDMSSYSPEEVFEGGLLWSRDADTAVLLRKACMIALTLLQARALLIYPTVIPQDISQLYRRFRRVGAPFKSHFANTSNGEDVWLQAMILDGEVLAAEKKFALHCGFACSGTPLKITFDKSPELYTHAALFDHSDTVAIN